MNTEELIAQTLVALVGAQQVLNFVSWALGKIAPRTENTIDDALLRWTRSVLVSFIQVTEFLRGASPSRAKAEERAK